LAARLARWPQKKIFIVVFHFKIRRTAFRTKPRDLRVHITGARGTNQLRNDALLQKQSGKENNEW
jgi:hypothetical protein